MKIRVATLKKLIREAIVQRQPTNIRVVGEFTAAELNLHSNSWYTRPLNSLIEKHMQRDKNLGNQVVHRNEYIERMDRYGKFIEIETALGKRFLVWRHDAYGYFLYNETSDSWGKAQGEPQQRILDAIPYI